jgi:hypothetical protein
MFDGEFQLEGDAIGVVVSRNPSQQPLDADALPTYRVYAGSGLMAISGTLSKLDTGTITGASNTTPISITSTGHGRQTGDRLTITGVGGNTAANNTYSITVVDANTFTLDNSVGNGAYTSGGLWHMSGLYRFSIPVTSANGFAAGQVYHVLVQALVSGFPFTEQHTFRVI